MSAVSAYKFGEKVASACMLKKPHIDIARFHQD